jgi:hypothetical protein
VAGKAASMTASVLRKSRYCKAGKERRNRDPAFHSLNPTPKFILKMGHSFRFFDFPAVIAGLDLLWVDFQRIVGADDTGNLLSERCKCE